MESQPVALKGLQIPRGYLGDLEDKGLAITEDIGKALADVRALIEKQTVVA